MKYEDMTVTIPAIKFAELIEDQVKLHMVANKFRNSKYNVYPEDFEEITGINVTTNKNLENLDI